MLHVSPLAFEDAVWKHDEKIEPYLCGDEAELREIADDVEMFVHARYAVISAASGAIFGSAPGGE